MPLRDFECNVCGFKFESYTAAINGEPKPCEECGSTNTKRLISFPGSYTIKGNNSASTKPRGGAFKKGRNG